MPIVGLTTKTDFGAGLPLIARLYKGEEKPEQGNRPGKDLNYFRVEFEPQFEHLREIWTEMYGDEPDEFEPVFLASATVDEAFSSWKEEWTATTMLHRCDGEYQKNWYNVAAQMYSTAKVPCAVTEKPACGCKAVGRLNMILPEFIEAAGVLGYVSVSTHSLNDILTVYRYLADIERIAGKLTGVPFIFGRAAREVSAPKQVKKANGYVNEGRIKVTKSLFYVHVAADFTQQHLLPLLAGVTAPTQAQLPAPKADVELAKSRLGSGSMKSRRIGYVPDDIGLEEFPTIIDGATGEIIISDSVPSESQNNDPLRVLEHPQPVSNSENAPEAVVEANQATPEQVEPVTNGYQEWELKNAVLKTCYNNNTFHLEGSLKKLVESGKLHPALTLAQAIEVVKTRKDDTPAKAKEAS